MPRQTLTVVWTIPRLAFERFCLAGKLVQIKPCDIFTRQMTAFWEEGFCSLEVWQLSPVRPHFFTLFCDYSGMGFW